MQPVLLKKKIKIKSIDSLKALISGLQLHTICTEASCPNISDCFSKGYATFLILGDICTRSCQFCGVKKGTPVELSLSQLTQLKQAVQRLKLKHVVITSPSRDDLADGGAGFFYQVISQLKKLDTVKTVEVLVPDFKGSLKSLRKVAAAKPDIIGHNLETVARLYSIREGADYLRSLSVLKAVKKIDFNIKTKSALILGLGEKKEEVLAAIEDLAEAGCDYLAIGQYLSPCKNSYPVKKIIAEAEFMYYKEKAYSLGFAHVEAGTYVRSSYHAEKYLNKKSQCRISNKR